MSTVDPAVPGINHLCLSVQDLAASLAFYDRVMPAMGFRSRRSDASTAYAVGNHELYLQQAKAPEHAAHRFGIGLQHLAFNAPSCEAVDALYRLLRELAADVTDAPAAYPQYTPDYYAVFFRDPSGIQLEYCYCPDLAL